MRKRANLLLSLAAVSLSGLMACESGAPEAGLSTVIEASSLDAGGKADGATLEGTRLRIVAANLTTRGSYDGGEGLRILQGLKPDVVLLQEFRVGGNQASDHAAFAASMLGEGAAWFREAGVTLPNGILSRHPILASGQWTDPETTDRGFAWARIDIPGPTHLFAVSVHLLTRSATARANEARALAARIAAEVPADDYLVIGGDFNTGSRREAALGHLGNHVVTAGPYPRDGKGLDEDTNANRTKPYDWVLVDAALQARATPVIAGTKAFLTGLVADTRTLPNLADFAPARATDSGAATMQHMAVARDFLVPRDPSCTPAESAVDCSPSRWLTRYSLIPVDTLSTRARETVAILTATHWYFDTRYGFAPQLPSDYGFDELELGLRNRLPHALSLFDLEQWRTVAIYYGYESPTVIGAAFDELSAELTARIEASSCRPPEDRGDLRHGEYWPGLYAAIHREEKTPEGHLWGVDLLVVERDGRMAVNRHPESWQTDAFGLGHTALPGHEDAQFCSVCFDGSCRLCTLSERDGVRAPTLGTTYAEPTVFEYEDLSAFELGMVNVVPGQTSDLGPVTWGPNGNGAAPILLVDGRVWAGAEDWIPALGPERERCNGFDDDDDGLSDDRPCPDRAHATARCEGYRGCTYTCATGYLDRDGHHENGCEAVVGSAPLPTCDEEAPAESPEDEAMITLREQSVPTKVQDLTDAIALAAGSDFACALRRGGEIRCWGRNHGKSRAKTLGAHPDGQSAGPVTFRMNLVFERYDNVGDWTPGLYAPGPGTSQLAAVGDVACAANGGTLWCWGDDSRDAWSGTPGHAWEFRTSDLSTSPLDPIVAIGPGRTPCVTLASGRQRCRNAPVAVFEWNGVAGSRGAATAIAGFPGCWRAGNETWCWRDATPVRETSALVSQAVGAKHRCDIAGGLVTCTGDNSQGQLGRTGETATPVMGVAGAVGVAVGLDFSCALLGSGEVSCWGADTHGQRGDGP